MKKLSPNGMLMPEQLKHNSFPFLSGTVHANELLETGTVSDD